jgi:hypothetical protein
LSRFGQDNKHSNTQRTESLKFKTEFVLKKYLIVPAYLNFRNDLNGVLNFSVDIIRFRHQSLHTEMLHAAACGHDRFKLIIELNSVVLFFIEFY